MKNTLRRQRQFDPLATPGGVREILAKLRALSPTIFPENEEAMCSLLNAARYVEKKSLANSTRGRPNLWPPEVLSEAIALLRELLARETHGRVSTQTFIGQHLRLLSFPPEIANALEFGQINKQEAAALARLTADRLQLTEEKAQELRVGMLKTHAEIQGSQNQLRNKVKEVLGEVSIFSRETLALGVQKSDTLLEFDRLDVKHIFFETMRDLFYAIRTLNPEDLTDEDISAFMNSADSLSNTLKGIELRITRRKTQSYALSNDHLNRNQNQPVEIISDPVSGQVIYKFH